MTERIKRSHESCDSGINDASAFDNTAVKNALGTILKSREFQCSTHALSVMRKGRILESSESPEDMIRRMVEKIGIVEEKFSNNKKDVEKFQIRVAELLFAKIFVPSTPIMTNLGRYAQKPLSACTVPPIDLKGDLDKIKETVDNLHLQGMGTGFNFDEVEAPIPILRYLNAIAVDLECSGKQDRPVGNIGLMSIYNKNIVDFIDAKKDADQRGEKWNFNLSVSVDDDFMDKVKKDESMMLTDGTQIKARDIFDNIIQSCYSCGDPGLVFFERILKDNPVPKLGNYSSLAPCGEIGLSKGDACQFGYINVSKTTKKVGNRYKIDYALLGQAVETITRFLDDALEYSIEKMDDEAHKEMMRKKRRIGVGICGFADMLIKMGIAYGTTESIQLLEDITSYINFHSKKVSVTLASQRGSFDAFPESEYIQSPSYILRRYSDKESRVVSKSDWLDLDRDIRKNGIRHSATIAYPPTGRSSMIFDASPQIEPIFDLFGPDGELRADLIEQIDILECTDAEKELIKKKIYENKSLKEIPLESTKALFRTSTELSSDDHLNMVTACQKFIDEGVSKTINLSQHSTMQDIKDIYIQAYEKGLKGITIYRNGSKGSQPRSLLDAK